MLSVSNLLKATTHTGPMTVKLRLRLLSSKPLVLLLPSPVGLLFCLSVPSSRMSDTPRILDKCSCVLKRDVVVGLPQGKAQDLDKEKPGWKISGM